MKCSLGPACFSADNQPAFNFETFLTVTLMHTRCEAETSNNYPYGQMLTSQYCVPMAIGGEVWLTFKDLENVTQDSFATLWTRYCGLEDQSLLKSIGFFSHQTQDNTPCFSKEPMVLRAPVLDTLLFNTSAVALFKIKG